MKLMIVAFLAIVLLDIVYGSYCWRLNSRVPQAPTTNTDLIRWWKIHQRLFLFTFSFNLVLLVVLVPLAFLADSTYVTITVIPLVIMNAAMVVTFGLMEAPYQTMLRRKATMLLTVENAVPGTLFETALFASVLPETYESEGPFEAARDVGFLQLDGDILIYHGIISHIEIDRQWIEEIKTINWLDSLAIVNVRPIQISYTMPNQDSRRLKFLIRGSFSSLSYRRPNQQFRQQLEAWAGLS